MRVTVLGSGTSAGVPMIGCRCAVCTSTDPRNRRRRCAILVEAGRTRLLIDTPPELREQCVDAGVGPIDAVLYTHAHADHVNGIDDLRSFNQLVGRAIDAYADASVLAKIRARFDYAFHPPDPRKGFWRPSLNAIGVDGPFRVGGLEVVPIEQIHGGGTSFGFRIGPFAYSTDCSELEEPAFAALEGIEVWIVDCLRDRPHVSHAHLERTLGWIARVKPRRALLTHMNHEVDHADWVRRLPDGVEPAFDGLVLEV